MTGRIAHLVSACTVLQTTAAFVLPQKGSVKNVMELKFKNSYLEILESNKPRQRPTALGNQFRTVPRPYYQSNSGVSSGEYEQQSVKWKPKALSSSALSSSFPSASSSSDYGQNNVYWSDVNGFPPLQDQEQAYPSSRDMSIGGTLDFLPQRSFDQSRYSQDRERYDSSSSDGSFYDIPFKSNDMYARQFDSEERRRPNDRRSDGHRNPEGRRYDDRREPYDNRGSGRDMSGTEGYPPIDRYDFPSMMDDIRHNDRRPDGRHQPYDNRGRDMSGIGWYPPVDREDFPSMMDDIRPPSRHNDQPYNNRGSGRDMSGTEGYPPFDRYDFPSMMDDIRPPSRHNDQPYDNRGRDMSGTEGYPPVDRFDFPSMMDDIRPPPPPIPEWARPHESNMMMDPRSEEWGYGPPPNMPPPPSYGQEEFYYSPPPPPIPEWARSHESMMMDPRNDEWGYGPSPNMPPPPPSFYGHEEFYYNDMPPPPPMYMERPPFGDQHWGP
jgi:hypothetical protein